MGRMEGQLLLRMRGRATERRGNIGLVCRGHGAFGRMPASRYARRLGPEPSDAASERSWVRIPSDPPKRRKVRFYRTSRHFYIKSFRATPAYPYIRNGYASYAHSVFVISASETEFDIRNRHRVRPIYFITRFYRFV